MKVTEHVDNFADSFESGYASYDVVGGEQSFIFYFKIYQAGDVKVFKDGERVFDGYEVRFSGRSFGGEVFFANPLDAGSKVLLVQDFLLKKRRGTFRESGAFPVSLLNAELDILHERIRTLEHFKSRALHASESKIEAFLTDGALPLPEAGKVLMGRGDNGGWENSLYSHGVLETMLRDASRVASVLEAVPSVGQITLGFQDKGAKALSKGDKGRQLVTRASSMRFIHSSMEEAQNVTLAVEVMRIEDASVRYTHTLSVNVPSPQQGRPYLHKVDLGEGHAWTLSAGDLVTLEVSGVASQKAKGLIVAFA